MAIYVGARDLSGLAIGTHQFIVLTYTNPIPLMNVAHLAVATKYLGYGVRGIVIGAQNRGRLEVEFFEKGDLAAAKEFFGGVNTRWNESDYDAELIKVDYGTLPESEAKRRIYTLVESYILNQKTSPIKYPVAGLGVNSNSWAQSVVEYSGGKVKGDMIGLDISNDRRIPRTYFQSVCPAKPRVRVN